MAPRNPARRRIVIGRSVHPHPGSLMIACTPGKRAQELPPAAPGGQDPRLVPVLTNITVCRADNVVPELANIWRPNSVLTHIPSMIAAGLAGVRSATKLARPTVGHVDAPPVVVLVVGAVDRVVRTLWSARTSRTSSETGPAGTVHPGLPGTHRHRGRRRWIKDRAAYFRATSAYIGACACSRCGRRPGHHPGRRAGLRRMRDRGSTFGSKVPGQGLHNPGRVMIVSDQVQHAEQQHSWRLGQIHAPGGCRFGQETVWAP
jgi:hypothetical protein